MAERRFDFGYQRLKSMTGVAVLASLLTLGAARVEAEAMDREAFLKAVAEVETGGNPRAVGRLGERGLYQFNRPTWKSYTKRSFLDAHDPAIAHDIAVQHFIWLHTRLTANGRQPTDYQMAVAWNSGLRRSLSGKIPRSTRDYARRVSTLANRIRLAKANRPGTGEVVAAAPAPAPASSSAEASNPTQTFSLAMTNDTPQPAINFTLSDAMVEEFTANEVVPLDAPETVVAFSLSPKTGSESSRTKRFFLATIVE